MAKMQPINVAEFAKGTEHLITRAQAKSVIMGIKNGTTFTVNTRTSKYNVMKQNFADNGMLVTSNTEVVKGSIRVFDMQLRNKRLLNLNDIRGIKTADVVLKVK